MFSIKFLRWQLANYGSFAPILSVLWGLRLNVSLMMLPPCTRGGPFALRLKRHKALVQAELLSPQKLPSGTERNHTIASLLLWPALLDGVLLCLRLLQKSAELGAER